jgi:hypothetical protein
MSNFGVLAILRATELKALTASRNQLAAAWAEERLLLALETIPPDSDGVRRVGMRLLADQAGLPYNVARRARDRLIAAGLIKYEAAHGPGSQSRWAILLDLEKSPPKVGSLLPVDNSDERAHHIEGKSPPESPDQGEREHCSKDSALKKSARARERDRRGPSPAQEPDVKEIIEAIRIRTGKTVTEDQARAVAAQIITRAKSRDGLHDLTRYVITAIQREPDPRNFLPTPGPPRFAELCPRCRMGKHSRQDCPV